MQFGGLLDLTARAGLSRLAIPTIFALLGWTHVVAANRFPLRRKMLS
jgi:hypothetical protein